MTTIAIAERSKVLIVLAVAFLGGGSLFILADAVTFEGGVRGYLENYDGRRSPWLLLPAAAACLVMMAWWTTKMARRRKPPVCLEGSLLHSELWKEPLDMDLVVRIGVDQSGCLSPQPSNTVFFLADGSERRLPISFYEESASGIAADLGERFGLAVNDPTIEAR